MIRYLAYKVWNSALLLGLSRKIAPLISTVGCPELESGRIFVDLSDGTTHFGDRLFFLPLLLALADSHRGVCLSDRDRWTNPLIVNLLGSQPLPVGKVASKDLVLFPKPSYFNFRGRYQDAVLVDFTDRTVIQKISLQLVDSMAQACFLSLSKGCALLAPSHLEPLAEPDPLLPGDGQYVLFSNYISSGLFRKYFLDEGKLLAECIRLKRDGYRVVHVGSAEDLAGDPADYPFVDIDLRGKIDVARMVRLARSPQVVAAVTYDNFLMHLMGIYQKRAYVLFRGRFSRANYNHHMHYINNTFFDDASRLAYL